METLYNRIVSIFNANEQIFRDRSLPPLRTIDINYGQPDDPERFEIFLPALFISWSVDKEAERQPHVATLDFHLIQAPGTHTENFSERLSKGLEYLRMMDTVKYILNNLRSTKSTGLIYANERPVLTPYFRYHIISYQCHIDGYTDSLTKGSLQDVDLTNIKVEPGQIKHKTKPDESIPGIDTYKL
jgi:hypothetical protein